MPSLWNERTRKEKGIWTEWKEERGETHLSLGWESILSEQHTHTHTQNGI